MYSIRLTTTCFLITITLSTITKAQFIDPWCSNFLRGPPHSKLVFSERSTKGELKYQTQILWYGDLKCGGALIQIGETQGVLTSASCLDVPDHFFISVQAGDWDLENYEDEQVREVDQVYFPDNYNKSRPYENDIALITLTEPFNLDNWTLPIEMVNEEEELNANTTFLASGWGEYFPGIDELTCKLMKIYVPLVETQTCQEFYTEHGVEIRDSMFCMGILEDDSDDYAMGPCDVDFGGPLIDTETGKLTGIMSHTYRCGRVGVPNINTKVSHFVNWIESKLNTTKSSRVNK